MRKQPTPGPWAAVQCHLSGNWFVERRDRGFKSLIAGPMSDCLGHGGDKEANARLIAAAPDLLVALEAVVSLSGIDELPGTNGGVVLQQVRSAIAKAIGNA